MTLILVLAGNYVLQLTRDQSGVDLRQREKIAKTLVPQFSPLVETDDTETIGKAMDAWSSAIAMVCRRHCAVVMEDTHFGR